MSIEYRYTRHELPRGARPDAERDDVLYLLKNVSSLRLTYQIGLLVFLAAESQRRVVIRVPSRCRIHHSLRNFQKQHAQVLHVERV
jgi:hypothetical protein